MTSDFSVNPTVFSDFVTSLASVSLMEVYLLRFLSKILILVVSFFYNSVSKVIFSIVGLFYYTGPSIIYDCN